MSARDAPRRRRVVNVYVSGRFRELRTERGLSQRQVAALLSAISGSNWTVQAVSRAELCHGVYIRRWNVDDLFMLAAAFDMPVTYFLPEEHHRGGSRSSSGRSMIATSTSA